MRPIGTQMRALLEASEILGRPAKASELNHLLKTPAYNATKVCVRAITHGLMWADKGKPRLFQAVRGWREMVAGPEKEKPFHPAPQVTNIPEIRKRMGPLFTCWQ